MKDDDLPGEVCAFVRAHIPSIGHMEALVLTVEEPLHVWTAESLAGRLFMPKGAVGFLLRDLSASGLVEYSAPGVWRFARYHTMLTAVARRAVRLYRQRLVPMTTMIRVVADARQVHGAH